MIAGLVIGLMASLHCIGMCGPIALALPLNRTTTATKWIGLMQYGLGKTIAYTLLGVLIGMIGAGVQLLNGLQILSIVLGALTILYGFFKIFAIKISVRSLPSFGGFSSLTIRFFKSKSPFRLLLIGLANGFLPCGMVILALTNALVVGSTMQAIWAMVGFGLGTLPILFSVNLIGQNFSSSVKSKWAPMLPYYIVLVGAFIVLRGLNLGIPYLSPKIEKPKIVVEQNDTYRMQQAPSAMHGYSCCSKPETDSLQVK